MIGWGDVWTLCSISTVAHWPWRWFSTPSTSVEGYRLVWYRSSRKVECDALTRSHHIERAILALTALVEKLRSPRTRYPEGRNCRYPTTRRLIDVFENVQRHRLDCPERNATVMYTELSKLQRRILKLLGLQPTDYGR